MKTLEKSNFKNNKIDREFCNPMASIFLYTNINLIDLSLSYLNWAERSRKGLIIINFGKYHSIKFHFENSKIHPYQSEFLLV